MNSGLRWLLGACSLVLMGCGGGAGIATATDFDPATDFAAYGTYAWVPAGDGLADATVNGFIRAAVDRELQAKGLRKVEGASADAAVGYQLALNTSTTHETVGRGWRGGYVSTSGYSGGGAGVMQRDVEHEAGTLFIVLFDQSTKESVWTGVGNGFVESRLSEEDRQARINAVVKEILSAYPPG